jgi:hypothetical protein
MRVINFDRGSKRRLRQVRWTLRERTSVALLLMLLVALCILVELWDVSHEHPFVWETLKAIRSNLK